MPYAATGQSATMVKKSAPSDVDEVHLAVHDMQQAELGRMQKSNHRLEELIMAMRGTSGSIIANEESEELQKQNENLKQVGIDCSCACMLGTDVEAGRELTF